MKLVVVCNLKRAWMESSVDAESEPDNSSKWWNSWVFWVVILIIVILVFLVVFYRHNLMEWWEKIKEKQEMEFVNF